MVIFCGLCSGTALALTPDEILVIANKNFSGSVDLAKYYMAKRNLPKGNLIKLWVTDKEWCSREEYEKEIAASIRKFFKEKDPHRKFRCLLIMYGMPLTIMPPGLTPQEKKEVKNLEKKAALLYDQMKSAGKEGEERKNLEKELGSVKEKIATMRKADYASSLDSELALVLEEDYPLSRWIPNPLFLGFREKERLKILRKVLMVSRLDGPSEKVVRRIIDESVSVEEKGLTGTAYFDARWPDPGDKKVSVYGFYDRSLYRTAGLIKKQNLMPVVVESTQELFQPGDCPDAALYCGWYKLANYVDAFVWKPGSIGYHIASGECKTLKQPNSLVWCKMILEKGVAATLGPVGEPYLQSFPPPELFFSILIRGDATLAETYALSNPFLSWKMVLIGDPLYRPFKHKPASMSTPGLSSTVLP